MLSCFDLLVELLHFAVHVKLVVPRPFEQTVVCGEVRENGTAIYTRKKKNSTKELYIYMYVTCLHQHALDITHVIITHCNDVTKAFTLYYWNEFYYWNDVLILCIKDSINWIIEKWLKHVNKKNFPWFVVVYDFYTAQMFSILSYN